MARQINLVNPALRKTRDWFSALPLAVVASALVLIVAAAAVAARINAAARHVEAEQLAASQKQSQDALLAATQQLAARKPDPALAAELAKTRALMQRQQEVLARLDSGAIGNTQGFSAYLHGFARQVPQGLWLTGFKIGAGGQDMEVRGRMLSPQLLPEYVQRLNAESAFRGHGFAGLQIQAAQTEGAVAVPRSNAPTPAYTEFVLSAVPPGEPR